MSIEYRKSEEKIKQKIVSAHRRGKCDRDGNSVLDSNGQMVAPPTKYRGGKIFVMRNGKLVEKNSLDNHII